jgi:hypothetical protein
MKTAIVHLKSVSPYNQSRQHFVPKLQKETHDDYEKRTWIEKGHFDDNGVVVIPPMALKSCLSNAAKMLSIPIPGKGKSLYTKHFVSGVMVVVPPSLGVKKTDVKGYTVSLSGMGRKGEMGVQKTFPHFQSWETTAEFVVMDDTITKEIFERVINEAGNFVGIGQFRPQNGGYFGRFNVVSVKWR